MTDKTPTPAEAGREGQNAQAGGRPTGRAARRAGTRPAARRSRIAAVGIGVAAMVGLVSTMEVSGSHAQATAGASATAGPSLALDAAYHRAMALRRATAAALNRPIVLTPHTVVHAVGGSSSGGSGGYVSSAGSGYTTTSSSSSASSAPAAPAAAPVASTSGSH